MTRRPWCSPAGREFGYGTEAMATALAAFGKLARAGIGEADALGDKDSADVFTEISRGVDKWLWLVEAHLQADPWCRRAGRRGARLRVLVGVGLPPELLKNLAVVETLTMRAAA
jgi:hypothetical protein